MRLQTDRNGVRLLPRAFLVDGEFIQDCRPCAWGDQEVDVGLRCLVVGQGAAGQQERKPEGTLGFRVRSLKGPWGSGSEVPTSVGSCFPRRVCRWTAVRARVHTHARGPRHVTPGAGNKRGARLVLSGRTLPQSEPGLLREVAFPRAGAGEIRDDAGAARGAESEDEVSTGGWGRAQGHAAVLKAGAGTRVK